MANEILDEVLQAAALTRAGRLMEATRVIQRSLAGRAIRRATRSEGPANAAPAADDFVIEGQCSEVGEAADDSAVRLRRDAGVGSVDPGVAEHEPSSMPAPAGGAPGEWIAGVHSSSAGDRAYKLYVPSRHAGQSLPLVVMLHGCNQTPDDFATGTQMNAVAEERNCFVLYPAQPNSANHARCWNWFKRDNQVRDQGEPAILAGMTRQIVERWGIDSRKVYVAGMSAGGAMAAIMGAVYPDLYAAVGIHSGLACGSAHDLPSALAAMNGMQPAFARGPGGSGASSPIPTIVFHGDQDKTVHPRNGADVIARSAHRDGGDGGSVATERGTASGHSFTRTLHRDAAGRVLLEHWQVHGGGHMWFGGSSAGSYSDPRGPNAAAEMLRFFLQTS